MKRLFYNIDFLATFDSEDSELTKAYLLVEDNRILSLGSGDFPYNLHESDLKEIEEKIDCSGKIIIPGMVNTHHHLYQSMFRNVKAVQNSKLFDWLTFLYEKWKYIRNEDLFNAVQIGIYEMMKTGVTTTSDMAYLYPKGTEYLFDSEIEAARLTGIRFHPCRGSMSLSKKDGGLPPDSVVQTNDKIISDSERVIKKYHDPAKYSMCRVALAPCSPFSVTEELMRETLKLSEKYDVLLHTHLAETKDEDIFCLEKVGMKPVEYMESLGWLNPKVWFAHCVWLDEKEIEKFEANRIGVSHCPTSNMRLGSGIAPIVEMKRLKKIRLSLAVDGSASNDTGNFMQEIRNALLLQRVVKGADCISPREVLKMGCFGGAKVLMMDDYIGSLEPGKAADFIAFNLNRLEFAGSISDPLSALVLCNSGNVDMSVINGEIKIKDGEFLNKELSEIISFQNTRALEILNI